MVLLVISESKLKIMLTAPDMVKYDLPATQVNGLSLHHREALRHLFRDAKTESGFDTEGSRLFVQLYSSREGGCEIFVTKLPESSPLSPVWEYNSTDTPDYSHDDLCLKHSLGLMSARAISEDRLLRAVQNADKQALPLTCLAYRFSELESLLAVCRRLDTPGHRTCRPERSRVYIVDRVQSTDWYLLLEYPSSLDPDFLLFLSEYAVPVDPDYTAIFLEEHGAPIAEENAIEILKNM